MCGSMVDIQSAAAEIRRGKKERTTGQKYNVHRAAIKNARQQMTVSYCGRGEMTYQ